MLARLTQSVVNKAKIKIKRYDIRDLALKGFFMRVEISGKKTFFIDFKDPNTSARRTKKVGTTDVLTLAQAREKAKNLLSKVQLGEDPAPKNKVSSELTLQELINQYYVPWVALHHRTKNSLGFLHREFNFLMQKKPGNITVYEIEMWRTEARKTKKSSSVNRALVALKALFAWAEERELIKPHPLTLKGKVKPLKESDSREIIRYLTTEERQRLMAVLEQREKLNGKDHLRPAVITALNTGLRRKTLLSLLWSDIDFRTRIIALRSLVNKNQKFDYIPMNQIVYVTLREWKEYLESMNKPLCWVFPSPKPNKLEGRMNDCNSAWKKLLYNANIQNFRWHDMRHDYASQLVMQGVDILTVKNLMCHSKIELTLRYAHLAPTQKTAAVETLEKLYR